MNMLFTLERALDIKKDAGYISSKNGELSQGKGTTSWGWGQVWECWPPYGKPQIKASTIDNIVEAVIKTDRYVSDIIIGHIAGKKFILISLSPESYRKTKDHGKITAMIEKSMEEKGW